jgi:uncharacterized protein YgiM (DUF1202 family)
MKKTIMKKYFIALFAIFFLVAATGPAFARSNRYPYARSYYHRGGGYYPVYHSGYHHRYSNDDVWVALGVGLLTGGLISYMVNPPPSRRVVYAYPADPIVAPAPSRVMVKEYAYTPPTRLTDVKRVLVTAQELNVRRGPGFHHAVAGYAFQDETLDVLGSAPGWFYVRTTSGLHGWVMTNFTVPQTLPAG